MKRLLAFAIVGLVLTLPNALPAGGLTPGTWKLTTLTPVGNTENTNLLFTLATKDGKTTASLLTASPAMAKAKVVLVSFTTTGDYVRLVVKTAAEQVFEGRITKDGKKIMGVFGPEGSPSAAYMEPSAMTKIEAGDVVRKLGIDQLDQVAQLNSAYSTLMIKAQSTKDDAEKEKLQKEAKEALAKADAEVPKLYIETIQKHPNTFAAGRAAMSLLQRKAHAATPEELKNWAALVSRSSADYGAIFLAEMNTQIASALLARKSQDLALEFARAAEKALDDKCSTDLQVKVLEMVINAHKQAKSTTSLEGAEERLVKLNKILDDEFLIKVPPFKGQMFAGRKAKSARAVVMELFTGAQCPPCVAADVAFDVLENTYKANDLVLIQYHMHIPGPDPMTNPDTEARWKYYRDAHGAKSIGGTPTTLFNGQPKGGGGGFMEHAELKYNAYRSIIDPLLEEPATCKVTASAKRVGDKVYIETAVQGLEKTGKEMKLRLLLLEETVRFAGVNKLRFHHQVVRAMPGGAEGASIMNSTMSTKNEFDLNDLRKRLTEYLDNYAAKVRPFPQAGRPMEFQHLRVIAMVQDDTNHEILQATQVDVVQ